jgi:hypothetical protein
MGELLRGQEGRLTNFIQGGCRMSRRTLWRAWPFFAAGCLLLAAHFNSHGAAKAAPALSDFVGVYALVDRVVFEPNAAAPERVQIWGAFALAHAANRNDYESPQRGYFYYSLAPGKGEACRKEWADFNAVAGSGQVIGFGGRDLPKGRLRRANEKADSPDTYPVAWGLTKMSQRSSAYRPIQELRALPAPHSPAEGAEVKAGRVTLVAGNIADPERRGAKYVFEIKAGGSAEQETSPPVAAGEKETKWSPGLKVKAGETYTWRVRATDGQWSGPTASSEFKGVR